MQYKQLQIELELPCSYLIEPLRPFRHEQILVNPCVRMTNCMAHFGTMGMKQNITTTMNQMFYGKSFNGHQ